MIEQVSEADLKPGDIFVTPTYGSWYDHFIGAGIRFVTASENAKGEWVNARVNHTGVYVGDGQIVEAKPHGATLSPWDTYANTATWSVHGVGTVDQDGKPLTALHLTDQQHAAIAAHARSLVGVPYGFLDILAVGLAQKRMGARLNRALPLDEQPWWVQRIQDMRSLICSQLVDTSYARAGVQLFADHRLPGFVTPADIETTFL